MNTLTKLALGLMGQLQTRPASEDGAPELTLPAPRKTGGMPLFEALHKRESQREFSAEPLRPATLSQLLWCAAGINRNDLGGRVAPSAMNAQEVLLYVALPEGLYRYDPGQHLLRRTVANDVRAVSGYQDFVDSAPLDLIYVADHGHMRLVPAARREAYAFASAGAMAQNVYLFCASAGLATVVRAWFDHAGLARAMGLGNEQQLLLTQTVGTPAGHDRP